MDIFLTIP